MTKSLRCLAFLLSSSLLFAGAPAIGQTLVEARVAELERTVQQLQQRISALEAQFQKQPPNAPLATRAGSSRDIRNWRQVRQGMSDQAVEALLGTPGKVDVNEYFFMWYYNYPSGGTVQFKSGPRTVEAWTEP